MDERPYGPRVREPDRRRQLRTGVAVIPYVHPQPGRPGFAAARLLNRHRDIVGVHLTRHQHVLTQQVIQRLQQFADRAGPAPQRGTTQLHALTAVYLRLTIVRRVLRELRRDDARQQAGARVAALNGF